MKRPELEMNGIKIDATPNSIIGNTLGMMAWSFKYRSKENLVLLLIESRRLVIDWLKSNGRGVRRYEKEIENLQSKIKTLTRGQALHMIYEQLLRSENLGTLHGFGLSNNFNDKVPGNPEIKSIVKL